MALQPNAIALAFGSADDRAQSAESFWPAASTSLHPSRNLVALALSQRLAILPLGAPEASDANSLPRDACNFPEQITSLCWVGYAGNQPQLQDCCLVLGTSLGYMQLHAEDGELLHRQKIHTSQAQSVQARTAGLGLGPDERSEDITITFRDAIVKLSSLEIRSLVRQQEQSRRWGDNSTTAPLSYNIWDLRKAGPRSAGMYAGRKPPSLYGSLTGRESRSKLLLVTSGRDPALAAYEAEEVLQRGSLAFVTGLASSVASGVLGVARAAAWGRQSGYRAGIRNWVAAKVNLEQPGSPRDAKDEDLPKGEPVTLFRSLRDGPRAVEQLLMAPRGSLAVASDSLGRVLLIDVASLTVIRMWKSYRDAQFGWVMCATARTAKTSGGQQSSGQAHAGKRRRADAEQQRDVEVTQHTAENVDAGAPETTTLHLVLYAPRRQALELWQIRHGHRVAITHVDNECKLLQRSRAFGLDPDVTEHAQSDAGPSSGAIQCLVLDTLTGQTVDVLAVFQKQMHQQA